MLLIDTESLAEEEGWQSLLFSLEAEASKDHLQAKPNLGGRTSRISITTNKTNEWTVKYILMLMIMVPNLPVNTDPQWLHLIHHQISLNGQLEYQLVAGLGLQSH